MFKNGSMWCPPPIPKILNAAKKRADAQSDKQSKGQLTNA